MAADEEVTITREAPQSFAIWRANVETPPPIPWMRTVSPGRSAARVTSSRHAVSAASGKAAAFLGRQAGGRRVDVRRGDGDLLGERAREVLAENAERDTEALLPRTAEFARAAREARLEDHAGPDRRALRPRAQRLDDAEAVRAGDVREGDRDARDPGEDEEVEAVQGGRLDPHENFARTRSGIGPVAVLERVEASVRREEESLHFLPPEGRLPPAGIMRNVLAPRAPRRSGMRAWEIRQKRAQKRARELARKEKNKQTKETSTFRLVVVGREPAVVESVIVKNPDESVAEATFEEIELGMTLIVEGERGLIQRAAVEEKVELTEPEPLREVRVRVLGA